MRRSTVQLSRILHHEWIHQGKMVSSNESASLQKEGTQTVLFLHGLLGSGKNLRTLAKKFTQQHTHISALLMDARGHGMSTAQQNPNQNFPEPHSLKNCALDVIQTLQHLQLTSDSSKVKVNNHQDPSPVGIIGHSFGARVAIEYLHTLSYRNPSRPSSSLSSSLTPPHHTWLLDAVPGAAHASVANVIHALQNVSLPISSKQALVEELIQKQRLEPPIAHWMTTNLVPSRDKNGFEFAFDLEMVTSILQQFNHQSVHALLRDIQSSTAPLGNNGPKVNVVRALKNDSWTADVLSEFDSYRSEFLHMHTLNTGHWVHVDDLNGLLKVMQDSFCNKV